MVKVCFPVGSLWVPDRNTVFYLPSNCLPIVFLVKVLSQLVATGFPDRNTVFYLPTNWLPIVFLLKVCFPVGSLWVP